jgi:ParB family chromosome partitioning protein
MAERKSILWFKADANQPRKSFDDGELRQLGESLKAKQLYPVICRSDGTIIDGERRWRAAQLVGLEMVDCVVVERDLSESQLRQIQLESAIHRADLKAPEKWQAAEELMLLNPSWKRKDLAAFLHIDPSHVTRLMAPSETIPAVREAFVAGRLGISDVYCLSKMSEKDQHEALALALTGETRDELEERGRRKRHGNGRGRPKLARLNLKLGNVGVSVAAKELSLDSLIEWLGELRKRALKAKEDGISLKSFERVLKDKATKGVSDEAES